MMGYMGLNHWGASDKAADLMFYVFNRIAKSLKEGLKETGNEYNTCGIVNVALFNEAFLCPIRKKVAEIHSDELMQVLAVCCTKLEKLIQNAQNVDWNDSDNKKEHITAYKRLLKKLKLTLKEMK